MAPGGGDFERPPRLGLAAHVGEVGRCVRGRCRRWRRWCQRRLPGEVGADGEQRRRGEDVALPGQRRFAGARHRQDEGLAVAGCLQRHGQRAAHRAQLAGEREFAGKFMAGQAGRRNLPAGGEDAEGDRQVEAPGFLGQVGRGQVYGDAAGGVLEAGIDDRGTDAVACLANFGVGQADQGQSGQPVGQVHLDGDRRRVEAVESPAEGDGQRHELIAGCRCAPFPALRRGLPAPAVVPGCGPATAPGCRIPRG